MSKSRVDVRLLLLGIILGTLVSPPQLHSAEPLKLSDIGLDLYALKKWGTRHYTLYQYRKKELPKNGGVFVLERTLHEVARTPLTTIVEGDNVIMQQYWRDPQGQLSRTMVRCECAIDNQLSLKKMAVRYQNKSFEVDVRRGRYEFKLHGQRRYGEWNPDTVTDMALMRLVTLLPRYQGAVYDLGNWTHTPHLGVRRTNDATVRCEGDVKITIAGREMTCTKFVSAELQMWVRDDGVLVRVDAPGWYVMEIDEPKAIAAVPTP